MSMETIMTATENEQQVLPIKPAIEATLYVKNDPDTISSRQAIDLLNTIPGVISAQPSSEDVTLIIVQYDSKHIRGNHIVQSLRKAGYMRTCIALMYFKGCTGPDFQNDAAQTVITHPGVIATERSAHKAYVLIVHFDPRQTQGSRIVAKMRGNGFTAMLVGC